MPGAIADGAMIRIALTTSMTAGSALPASWLRFR
jgi:hypothetical protein